MKIGEKKPFLPLFVGSTFADLQLYRRAVQDALTQLETIVRGMEHFGSKPGSPADECLKVVGSCKAYIGIFAMRYGSIPEGHDRSMTHLEYDEAQRLELPSLIYIIDEENQPILPKNVETGPGAEKLRELKELLKKRHVVSFFTTTDDIRARILHDVPELLKQMGAEISGDLELPESTSDADILLLFDKLPKLFAGKQVTIEFMNNGDYRSAIADECTALGLEIGATVVGDAILSTGNNFTIFAERDIALALCKLAKKESVRARAITAFGAYKRVDWTDDGAMLTPEAETGLIIKNIFQAESEVGTA